MRESTGLYPRVRTDAAGSGVVSHAGAVLLLDTIRAAGLERALSIALAPWRKPTAIHDPAKILLDVAVSLALGGDCLADIAALRAAPEVFGRVASDPTVSRLITALAADPGRACAAIDGARAAARRMVWSRAGSAAPDHGVDHRHPLVVDADATQVRSAFGQGSGGAEVQARLWASPIDRVGRPRPGRHRRTGGVPAAGGQRRVEHRCRPHHRHPSGAQAAAGPEPARPPRRTVGARPGRRGRVDP